MERQYHNNNKIVSMHDLLESKQLCNILLSFSDAKAATSDALSPKALAQYSSTLIAYFNKNVLNPSSIRCGCKYVIHRYTAHRCSHAFVASNFVSFVDQHVKYGYLRVLTPHTADTAALQHLQLPLALY